MEGFEEEDEEELLEDDEELDEDDDEDDDDEDRFDFLDFFSFFDFFFDFLLTLSFTGFSFKGIISSSSELPISKLSISRGCVLNHDEETPLNIQIRKTVR